MKVKEIKVEYTTGKAEQITPKEPGFLIVDERVYPTADFSMNDAYLAAARLLLSTMSALVDKYGSYTPLFDKLNEVVTGIKQQLSPATEAKEFAMNFQRNFLYDEILEDHKLPEADQKYKELFEKMEDFTKRAAERLAENATKDKSDGEEVSADDTPTDK